MKLTVNSFALEMMPFMIFFLPEEEKFDWLSALFGLSAARWKISSDFNSI